ncbi:MAG: hypothetical protein KJO31_17905 [Gammaproteobacteria bacterium]|nr:hypothetical protein [Gammaproteobacteria bacterium]
MMRYYKPGPLIDFTMNRRFTAAVVAVALAFLPWESTLAQDTDGSENEDRQLELSIVLKAEPLDDADLRALSEISSRRLLRDATLARVAQKMSSGLDTRETRWTADLFTSYRQKARLPDEIFDFLVRFMASAKEGSYVAADVLKTLPAEDERRSIALSALAEAFSNELSDKYTEYVIAYIERFDRHGPLNRDVVAAVAAIAASARPYTLRARAMKLVGNHETLLEERHRIYASLVRTLDSNDDPTLAQALQNYSYSSTPHPYEMMVKFSSRPYQQELIDVLVRDLYRHTALAVPVLEEFSQSSEFTESQRETLIRWATDSSSFYSYDLPKTMQTRLSLFRALWPDPTTEDLDAAIATLAEKITIAARRKAMYDIGRYYTDSAAPRSVVDAIIAALRESTDSELRYVGATLILDSEVAFAEKERLLLALIEDRPRDQQLFDLLLDQYDVVGLQSFVATQAVNRELPTEFRQHAIRHLGLVDTESASLSAETEAVLKDLVMQDDEIALGTAESTLSHWGIEPPLSERQKKRNAIEKEAYAAGVVTLVFTVASPIIFIAGLALIPMSVSPGESAASKRAAALLGWVAYGVAVFILWAYALFGSYGIHGNGAPLDRHLSMMAPFHIASLVGLVIVIWCIRKMARRRHEEPAPAAVAAKG